ncbi:MAG: hypothetical protein IJ059_04875, partial [Prevotella sp.]|nr:hypothetical protein [Prevotella sp.]
QELNGLFNYPSTRESCSDPQPPNLGGASARFLYYFFCLCKSFKELFFICASGFWPKADAKVRLFSELPKLFEDIFQENDNISRYLTKTRNIFPYYEKKSYLCNQNQKQYSHYEKNNSLVDGNSIYDECERRSKRKRLSQDPECA